MRIVVVEDEPDLARLAANLLAVSGHVATTEHAISDDMLTPAYWQDVDCAVIDSWMPRRNGEVLIGYLSGACPWVRTVLCTASVEDFGHVHADARLLKPYTKAELDKAVSG